MMITALLAALVQGEGVTWFRDYDQALTQAKKVGRILIIDAGRNG